MHIFDLVAVVSMAAGGWLGARRGFWKIAAGGVAVSLGLAAAWGISDVLAVALREWGVGSPGDAILGAFLPFALVSVYTRYVIGLWLARRLKGRPERNRLMGAAAGVAWVAFVAGMVARAALPTGSAAPTRIASTGAIPPVTAWLARYPGRMGAYVLGGSGGRDAQAPEHHARDIAHAAKCSTDAVATDLEIAADANAAGITERLAGTLKECLDGSRAGRRATLADDEAFSTIRNRVVPLRVDMPSE